MPGRHKDVIHALIRLTYGYGHTEDRIAVSQITGLTGIAPRHIRAIMTDLIAWKVIVRKGKRIGRANVLAVQKDYDRWQCGTRGGPVEGTSPRREHPRKGRPAKGTRRGPVQGRGGIPRAGPSKETSPKKERERPASGVPRTSVVSLEGRDWRPEDLVHLLGRKPGTKDEKLLWLDRELEKIVRDARAWFKNGSPDGRAMRAKVEKMIFSYWERRDRATFTPTVPRVREDIEPKAPPPSEADLAAIAVCRKLRKSMRRMPRSEEYAKALEAAGMVEAAKDMRATAVSA
jgi:phage replication O-like protein O